MANPKCPVGCGRNMAANMTMDSAPTLCLFFLCRGLVSEMDWASYRQYLSVSSRYLAFLTRTMRQVAAELSSRQTKLEWAGAGASRFRQRVLGLREHGHCLGRVLSDISRLIGKIFPNTRFLAS